MRTTQNKIYTQGRPDDTPSELKDGFPTKVEDLFGFQGLILGSVEANYFTPAQQELIQQFVDRRGGGLLFLGGRAALADGGYEKRSVLRICCRFTCRIARTRSIAIPATAELTAAGRDSLITRIEENPESNVERWKKLPYLMNFQEAGQPKPGALVLADMNGHRRQAAAADHGEVRARPNGGLRHRRRLALANAAAGRRI